MKHSTKSTIRPLARHIPHMPLSLAVLLGLCFLFLSAGVLCREAHGNSSTDRYTSAPLHVLTAFPDFLLALAEDVNSAAMADVFVNVFRFNPAIIFCVTNLIILALVVLSSPSGHSSPSKSSPYDRTLGPGAPASSAYSHSTASEDGDMHACGSFFFSCYGTSHSSACALDVNDVDPYMRSSSDAPVCGGANGGSGRSVKKQQTQQLQPKPPAPAAETRVSEAVPPSPRVSKAHSQPINASPHAPAASVGAPQVFPPSPKGLQAPSLACADAPAAAAKPNVEISEARKVGLSAKGPSALPPPPSSVHSAPTNKAKSAAPSAPTNKAIPAPPSAPTPTIEPIPSEPNIEPVPSVPSVPNVKPVASVPNIKPDVPSVPSVPNIKPVPSVPSVSNVKPVPLVPNIKPDVPSVPTVPNIKPVPSAPSVPNIKPVASAPSVPNISTPIASAPNVPKITPIPSAPCVPNITPTPSLPLVPNIKPLRVPAAATSATVRDLPASPCAIHRPVAAPALYATSSPGLPLLQIPRPSIHTPSVSVPSSPSSNQTMKAMMTRSSSQKLPQQRPFDHSPKRGPATAASSPQRQNSSSAAKVAARRELQTRSTAGTPSAPSPRSPSSASSMSKFSAAQFPAWPSTTSGSSPSPSPSPRSPSSSSSRPKISSTSGWSPWPTASSPASSSSPPSSTATGVRRISTLLTRSKSEDRMAAPTLHPVSLRRAESLNSSTTNTAVPQHSATSLSPTSSTASSIDSLSDDEANKCFSDYIATRLARMKMESRQ